MSKEIDISLVINKIKTHFDIKSDAELARFLDIAAQTLSSWRSRNTADYPTLFAKCVGMDLNTLFDHKVDKVAEPATEYKITKTSETDVNTIYLTPQIITVDQDTGDENIVYVAAKAAAGYKTGYGDREYMGKLPVFSLPGLPKDSTYRAFQVSGDSMYPTLEDGEMIIGRWLENLSHIREDRVHIIVTKHDGILVKRLLNRIDKYGYIIAKSDALNDRQLYPNIEIRPEDVLEVWYAVYHGGFNFKAPGDLWRKQNNLEADVTDILRRLSAAGL